jgi:hypothetical protein
MIQTKKELIEQYRSGILKDSAFLPLSNSHSVVIVEADDENVFGYWGTNEHTNDFFKRKVDYTVDENEEYRPYFKMGQSKYYLSEFMRIR